VALKTLGQGDLGILLPEFICRDVPETCRRMGFAIRWYRVNKQLQPIGLSRMPSCRAVLAVHYFGFPQDLRAFKKYCQRTGAILIEDAAHGFLSRDAQGKLLGTSGDFGVFSFRKILPIPDGAGLKVSKKWVKKTRIATSDIHQNSASDMLWNLKRVLIKSHPKLAKIIRTLARPLLKISSQIKNIPLLQSASINIEENLKDLGGRTEVQRRRKAWSKFHQLGVRSGVKPVFTKLPAGVSPYGYAFFSDQPIRSIQKVAVADGFTLIRWPDLPKDAESGVPKFYKNIHLVNFLKSCPS